MDKIIYLRRCNNETVEVTTKTGTKIYGVDEASVKNRRAAIRAKREKLHDQRMIHSLYLDLNRLA